MTDPRPLRVVMIQFSARSDNLGVGALSVAQVAILREIAARLGRGLEITLFDTGGQRPPYLEGPDLRLRRIDRRVMLSPRGYLAAARAADLVIDIGGGDSFADIYGLARLRRMFLLKALTHLAGTPLVLAPQTVGPFRRGWSRMLARAALSRSALVVTRDSLSTAALGGLGYRGGAIEASDVALRLPWEPPPPRDPAAPPRVGLNVSGLLMEGGYTGRNEFGLTLDYPALVRALIAQFQAAGAEVHLVPHVCAETPGRRMREDDAAANAMLAAEIPGLVEAPRFASPSAAKSYIAGLDFFAGARMHACIAALSSGVAGGPTAYSRKFAGLFGSLGYDHTVDCTREDAGTVLARIGAAYEGRARLASEAAAALARGRAKLALYETALAGRLAAVPLTGG